MPPPPPPPHFHTKLMVRPPHFEFTSSASCGHAPSHTACKPLTNVVHLRASRSRNSVIYCCILYGGTAPVVARVRGQLHAPCFLRLCFLFTACRSKMMIKRGYDVVVQHTTKKIQIACFKAVGIGKAGEASASPLFTKVPAV